MSQIRSRWCHWQWPSLYSANPERLESEEGRKLHQCNRHVRTNILISIETAHDISISVGFGHYQGNLPGTGGSFGSRENKWALNVAFLGMRGPCQSSFQKTSLALLLGVLSLQCKTVQDQWSLQSLVGHLVHTSKVLPQGKAFLSQLFIIQNTIPPGQVRRLNLEAWADLTWWHEQCSQWSGVSISQFLLWQQPAHHLYPDVSGLCGCGALAYPHWIQIPRQGELPVTSIAFKELLPIVVAAGLWCHRWREQYILCHLDNLAAVSQVNNLCA